MMNVVDVLAKFDIKDTYTCGSGEFLFEGLFPQVILLNIFTEREETQGTHPILKLILKMLNIYCLLLLSH